jgi:cytochrome b involved in lipid metabolism
MTSYLCSPRAQVYDVTKFLKLHPGGKKVLLGVGGQECTEQFNQFHNAAAVLAKYSPKLLIGEVAGSAPPAKKAAAPKAAAPTSAPSQALTPIISHAPFGDQIPYGDASWYQGQLSAHACSAIHED